MLMVEISIRRIREIDRLITNIAKGADFDTYNPKVNELAAERKRVKAELAQIAAASEIVTIHPAAIERYLADIKRLAEVAAEAAELDKPVLVATRDPAPFAPSRRQVTQRSSNISTSCSVEPPAADHWCSGTTIPKAGTCPT